MKSPYLKRMNKVRKRSLVTCPASRHAAMIAEALIRGDECPMLSEDPKYCGETIAAVVAALWEAREATNLELGKNRCCLGLSDADLLAPVDQLPEVRALIDAADKVDDEYCGQEYGPTMHTIEALRAALAPFRK